MKDEHGEPWWVAKDVCGVLEIANLSQAISYLDADERCLISNEALRTNGSIAVINESGLYSLILRSRKPEAKAFKKWITSVVLPAIRKHGGYQLSNEYTAKLPASFAEAYPSKVQKHPPVFPVPFVGLMDTLSMVFQFFPLPPLPLSALPALRTPRP